jgi:N-acetylated-alpha-linked acidic dipeptidase
LEEARAFGALLRQGWKPKRTIVYCAWDGEEPGLIGSTEWVEAHADELARKGAVYINSDASTRGFLRVEGSHTLEKFVNGVARDVEDPESKVSVWQRLRARRLDGPGREAVRAQADLRIEALGSGSDYTPFLDHLGIASLNLAFTGEGGEGIYHSIYDDFYWYTHFSDTTFVYGRALAQTAGLAVMRLAGAELLPLDFDNFTDTVRRYVEEVKTLDRNMRQEIVERNHQIDEGVFAALVDPRFPTAFPANRAVPPDLGFAPLDDGVAALQRAAQEYGRVLARAGENGGAALARASLHEVNASLVLVERALTLTDGLPDRPWFRHQIYAPGFYTGYGVKTLPAVRESIEQQRWKDADAQIARVGKVLESAGEAIQRAVAALSEAVR